MASRGRWPIALPHGSSSGSSRAFLSLHHLLRPLLPRHRPLRPRRKMAPSRQVSLPTRHYTRHKRATRPPPASLPMIARWPTSLRRLPRHLRPLLTLPRPHPHPPLCSQGGGLQPRLLYHPHRQPPRPPTTDLSPITTTSTTAPTCQDAPPQRRRPTRWFHPLPTGVPRRLRPPPLLSGAPRLTP